MKAMRREIEGTDVAVAPVVSEGGRINFTTRPAGCDWLRPNISLSFRN